MTSPYDGATPNERGFRDITPEETEAAIGKVRIVDVRSADEYVGELGHIPQSKLVTLGTVPQIANEEGWAQNEDLIFVCRSGNRSGKAAEEMASLGYTRVMNMVGGMLRWDFEGRKVDK